MQLEQVALADKVLANKKTRDSQAASMAAEALLIAMQQVLVMAVAAARAASQLMPAMAGMVRFLAVVAEAEAPALTDSIPALAATAALGM
jgi:hypothetical protein